jgi:dynein heavy chain 1
LHLKKSFFSKESNAATTEDVFSESSKLAIEEFLHPETTSSSSSSSSSSNKIHRLFVYCTTEEEDEPYSFLQATSSSSMPVGGIPNEALCFCHDGNPQHLQCLTLLLDSASLTTMTNSHASTAWLPIFQLYTRAMASALQPTAAESSSSGASTTDLDGSTSATGTVAAKLRELDVAMTACTRSTRLPHVQLTVPSVFEKPYQTGDKIDWHALGLAEYLNDDDFLNELQQQVSQWIAEIRKITGLVSPEALEQQASASLSSSTQTTSAANSMILTSAADEVTFWNQLHTELTYIQETLKNDPQIALVLAMLRETKRFVAVLALENNTGLEPALAVTNDIWGGVLKQFPLADLQVARGDFDAVGKAVAAIFDYLPKAIRQSRYYSIARACELVSAITAVLRDTIIAILNDESKQFTNRFFVNLKEYETVIWFPALDAFVQLDDKLAEFKNFCIEHARRRKLTGVSKLIEKQLVLHHEALRNRLTVLHEFRQNHERLTQVVGSVLLREEQPLLQESNNLTDGPSNNDTSTNHSVDPDNTANNATLRKVEQAPRLILSRLDLLDLSPAGTKALESAMEEYDMEMDKIEERLAKLLRDKLTACRDAEDMFGVFARFNLLLTRSRVHSAVKEFQLQLIATVSSAIAKLQSKFTHKYETSASAEIARLRGIPPVAGKILWAKQMERQVHTLMERMGNVLGPNWGQLLEGRQLRKSGDELLAKLDARSFFRHWVMEWEKELASAATSKLSSYPIVIETESDGLLVAKVNFDEKSELLFKEIRHLKWLGFSKDIPRTLTMVAEEATARYPYSMAIKTALRSYQAVRVLVTPELESLVYPQLLDIREIISEVFDVVKLSSSGSSTAIAKKRTRRVRWDDTKEMTEWVTRLTEAVTKFEDRVEQLLRACDKVDIALNLLEQVEYDEKKFQAILASIQKTMDEMSLSGYSDLDAWVKNVVAEKMAKVLAKRLEIALLAWNKAFQGTQDDTETTKESSGNFSEGIDTNNDSALVPDSFHITASVTMEIVLRNQEISTLPALPTVRSMLLSTLHDYFAIVCNLPKPQGSRYEVFDTITAKTASHQGNATDSETFDNLTQMVPAQIITTAFAAIERHISEASAFAEQWLAYQTLWDTQVADVAASVGSDVEKWQKLLLEAAEARSTLDSSSSTAIFGPIVVKYGKVQSQINLKYDSWQKELQSSFASVLGQCIIDMHEKVSKAKTNLEASTLDSASTDSIVLGVTYIQEVKQKVSMWAKEIENLKESEKVLKRQRFVFHGDWMETSVVQGLYDSLLQVLDRRSRTMEQQIPLLQARVAAEDRSATKKLAELLKKWDEEKPLRGTLAPPEALTVLTNFELTMKKAHVHQENLIRAKDALGLEHSIGSTEIVDSLNELADLREVWEAVMAPFKSLEQIKDTQWSTAVMRKIRRGLDDLLASMRSLPNRIRQYDAYTQLHDAVKGYIAGHGLLSDLKTEALKERHWKTILQRLGIRVPFTDLTVGILWESGVLNRKKEMAEILAVAQGEMALEVFLGDVRERWMKQELELVLFQNRTRLIKGWDDLFATLDDHINGLALMRSSPYYKAVREFQEEGKVWEDRLTKLRAAFDAWVDVQRRWVYLEGILFGSSDIKAQLPAEWSRFKSVDSEFIALMRRIASKPYAMEVLNIDNLQRTLERLVNLMIVIQRALGEYLAKQRSDFSRFYFLGDDDLLEIMGNAAEPGKVLAHVGKMFAGIAGARLVTKGLPENVTARLDAMLSKDGEMVSFHEPIDIGPQSNVKDWLKTLENRMQTTLALLLEQAVSEDVFAAGDTLSDDMKTTFIRWTTKFPAQVMILATQINWSMGVENALSEGTPSQALKAVLEVLEWKLETMANAVLEELPPDHRKKFEQLITEFVRQRDAVRNLINEGVKNSSDFRWLYHLRYHYNPKAEKLTEKLTVSLSNASFYYGFEYLGIGERLVQTPLTDRCYLTLTQALHFRLGGSPFGPAGKH